VGPTSCLYVWKKRKALLSAKIKIPDYPVFRVNTTLTELSRLPNNNNNNNNTEFMTNRPDIIIIIIIREEPSTLTDMTGGADRNVTQKEADKKLKYKILRIAVQ